MCGCVMCYLVVKWFASFKGVDCSGVIFVFLDVMRKNGHYFFIYIRLED